VETHGKTEQKIPNNALNVNHPIGTNQEGKRVENNEKRKE